MKAANMIAVLAVTGGLAVACSAEDRSGSAVRMMKEKTDVEGTAPGAAQVKRTVAGERIVISSDRGQVAVELVDNDATRALLEMVPLTIEMRDHLRQEKTGALPAALPEQPRQTGFSAGTIGLWGNDDFVIYYRNGSVPRPGIIVMGRISGDVTMFDVPGPVTVRIQKLAPPARP